MLAVPNSMYLEPQSLGSRMERQNDFESIEVIGFCAKMEVGTLASGWRHILAKSNTFPNKWQKSKNRSPSFLWHVADFETPNKSNIGSVC
jgi:hypothetical protein